MTSSLPFRDVGDQAETIEQSQPTVPYARSWGLVVGISDYGNRCAPLPNARHDAEAFCELLRGFYQFEDVQSLYDEQASREAILGWLRDKIPSSTEKDDRVVIYFAGHGITQKSPTGALRGYLIPADAKPGHYADFIGMEELHTACGWMKAKHVFIILDCCFSGVAAMCTRADPTKPSTVLDDAYLAQITRRKAWQILTAGASDELVSDRGPDPDHSPFTGLLLRGLRGEADENSDHLITATELAVWLRPLVVRQTSTTEIRGQSPFFNYLVGSEQGDFVFNLPQSDVRTTWVPSRPSSSPRPSRTRGASVKTLLLLLLATLILGYLASLIVVGYIICAFLFYCGENAHLLAWIVCIALWGVGSAASVFWWLKKH